MLLPSEKYTREKSTRQVTAAYHENDGVEKKGCARLITTNASGKREGIYKIPRILSSCSSFMPSDCDQLECARHYWSQSSVMVSESQLRMSTQVLTFMEHAVHQYLHNQQ